MKYVITWWERPAGSAADYEAAQKRLLAIFQRWEMPASLQFHQFLVRVGEMGGCAVLEIDQPADIHRVTTAFAAFKFRVDQVLDVGEAVAAEAAAIAWREGLAG